MACDWPVLTLRESGVALIDCEHRTPPATASGYPYVAIPQMKQGRLDLSDARRISAEHFAEWTKKARPREHDVILSRRCNPGETVVVPADLDCALGQNLVLLRADGTKVLPPFLRWMVRGPEWWNQIGTFLNAGAIFDSLKCADIPNFRLSVPPLPEQRAIAGVLGALDDKIEVNRKTARVLEGIARAVFTSWFVDFDPVRRAAIGEPIGLPHDLVALFPKRLVDSPIGEVPEGWRVLSLPEVFEVNPTRSLKKGAAASYLDMSNMPTHGHAPAEWVQREAGSGMRFINGDTLVARITPCLENGKTAFVDFLADGEVAWGSTEYIVLRPKPPLPPVLAYLLARDERFRTHAIQAMTGSSGRQRVPAESLDHFQVAMPTDGAQAIGAAFATIVEPMFARMSMAMKQNRTLAALRDALLPKLISGELRIADAEKIVERATHG